MVEHFLGKDAIIAALDFIGGDGHTVWEASAFTELGLPRTFVGRYLMVHESDEDNPKGQLSDCETGQPMSECEGVYGLDLLWGLCRAVGAEEPRTLGRGWTARALDESIRLRIEQMP